MMSGRRMKLLFRMASAIAVAFLGVGSAHAGTVLFSDFGPGDSYSQNGGFTIAAAG